MSDFLTRAATPELSEPTDSAGSTWNETETGSNSHAEKKKGKLDFIIIGAPKCGTTSLHRYLQPHPELYLLPEKEVPFFTNPEYFAKGWDWYLNEFFPLAAPDKLWGKASPQYMGSLEVPEKIHAQLPQAKLIVLLRNPIDCTYSWHKMMVKRKREQRSFLEAVDEKLEIGILEQRPGSQVTLGEYSRMIKEYWKFYPREQLLILFAEDLKKNPEEVFKRVLRFLEVDESFVPGNLGKQYHLGGSRRRIPVDEQDVCKHPLFARVTRMIPWRYRGSFQRRFLFWLMIWNTRPDSPKQQMPAEAREKLRKFYREEVSRLEELLNQRVPWPDFASE